MVLFNHATREMTAKIVYYGPGLCGKTTNLMVVFDKLDPANRGKMLSLATKTDRTLFFDLLPVDIGKVGAFNLRIQLYTVPGQVFYNETRKLVLKGADAVVFVVDSQPSMVDSNRESFQNLMENLTINQVDPEEIPIIIQYNKRDIPGVLPVAELEEQLDFAGYPHVEASAVQGEGVMETFKLASKVTARHLLNKAQGKPVGSNRAIPARPTPVASEPFEEPASPAPLPPPINPFANDESSAEPFGESTPPDESAYEGVEEVSLEELLEGRERPLTMSGNVARPGVEAEPLPEAADEPEEVEELIETPEPPPSIDPADSAPAAPVGPSAEKDGERIAALEARINELEARLEALSGVLRELGHRLGSLA